jgi:hypothetical protein
VGDSGTFLELKKVATSVGPIRARLLDGLPSSKAEVDTRCDCELATIGPNNLRGVVKNGWRAGDGVGCGVFDIEDGRGGVSLFEVDITRVGYNK